MSDTVESTPRDRLLNLIVLLRNGSVSVEHFCSAFETVYNLELDKATLSERETAALGAIFDKIVWYSPFPEERKKIPNYIGEEEVKYVVASATEVLGLAT